MKRASSSVIRGALLALPLALAACKGGAPQSSGSVAAPASGIDAAIDLLNRGDEKGALRQIKAIQKHNPNDTSASVLVESIRTDPVTLLGAKSYAYTVQPGETMLGLSQRFLGNRLKFYQLARYNHVAVPSALAAGTVLRIPGEPPRPPEPTPRETAPSEPKPAKPKKPAAAVPAAPKAAAANPAAAMKLRSAGLAALNQGKVGDAVGLLRRASALDPANPLIARDLARAQRIAQAVQSKR
jgi:Flp pilus assembly protein TadD